MQETQTMTDALLAIAVVLVVLGLEYLFFRKRFRAAWGHTRKGVLKHITTPGVAFTADVSNLTGTWNPAHRRLNRYDPPLIYGKGSATYWRDDADHVHLLYRPESGSAKHLAAVVPPLDASPHKWAVRGVLALFAGLLLGGFVIGYSASSGSADDRAFVGFLGALAGVASLSVLTTVIQVGHAVRTMSRGTTVPAAVGSPVESSTPVDAGPVPEWVLAQLDVRGVKRARSTRYVPRARSLALPGVACILVASFALDPLSNSDRVSTRLGDLIVFVSEIVGYGGILLLIAAPVCFFWRR
jgi:hypothetical protein